MTQSTQQRLLVLSVLALSAALACSGSGDESNAAGGTGGTLMGGPGSGGVSSGGTGSGGVSSGDGGANGLGTGGAGVGGSSVGGSGVGGSADPGSGGSGGGGSVNGPTADGFYKLENLDRGLVAVQVPGGVFLSFRMLGHEYDPQAPENVSYAVYRDGAQIAELSGSTNYLDSEGGANSSYDVRLIYGGAEGPPSKAVTPWSENFLRIPLDAPSGAHNASDSSAGDVDGDGEYEIFVKWDPTNAQDNANAGVTGDVFIDCIKLDGTRLWRVNLGPNIRAGAHYTQFVVADFDGDGGAEMAVKTAEGTLDGTGNFLSKGPAESGNHSAIHRNAEGYILQGAEYLTVFDGATGAELETVAFDVPRGTVSDWGDSYGNRVDRFLAAAAYLDDTGLPSFIMARGYYTRTTLTAWNFRDGALSQLWKFDSNEEGASWTGQGAHSLSVANVDDDLGQEIIYGAMTVDHDGSGMCNTALNHGDALHATDLIPSRPGVEVFMPHEYEARPLWSLRDGRTCDIIHQGAISDTDVGRGVAADIDPGNPGAEMWASSGVPLMSVQTAGTLVQAHGLPINFLTWWDGDESRELLDGTTISKYGEGTLFSCGTCSSNNGTKSTPNLSADLLGDWREEIIWRETDNSALLLYTTTDETTRRIYTLMHDPQYRVAIAWQNVAYNQPPHPSFHIGEGMADPPVPNISFP
jgi:rhamnogalacturonan endolyase